MSSRPNKDNDHTRNVIAALQLLGAVPEGAENDPVLKALKSLGTAKTGLSEAEPPLAADDRPSWSAYHRLERENALLTDHAEMIACALGACPNCWGTIPDCEDCGGIGGPGAFKPDPSCFAHFIQPVLDRVLAEQAVDEVFARYRPEDPDRIHPMGPQ